MYRRGLLLAFTPALLAGYVLIAAPNSIAAIGNSADQVQSPRSNAELLAQAQTGLEAQEMQLLNQIQADDAKLKADEAAEQAHQRKPANPQIRYIRASLLHLSQAADVLRHASPHYSGHRAEALRAMVQAHNQLMQCYRIDSGQ
jgi:hypothetical protein